MEKVGIDHEFHQGGITKVVDVILKVIEDNRDVYSIKSGKLRSLFE